MTAETLWLMERREDSGIVKVQFRNVIGNVMVSFRDGTALSVGIGDGHYCSNRYPFMGDANERQQMLWDHHYVQRNYEQPFGLLVQSEDAEIAYLDYTDNLHAWHADDENVYGWIPAPVVLNVIQAMELRARKGSVPFCVCPNCLAPNREVVK